MTEARKGALADLKLKLDGQLAEALPGILRPGEEVRISTWGDLAHNAVAATLWGSSAGHPGLARGLLSLAIQAALTPWSDIGFLVLAPPRLLVIVGGGGKLPLKLSAEHAAAGTKVKSYKGPSSFGGAESRLDLDVGGEKTLWFRTTKDWADDTKALAHALGWSSAS